MENELDITTDSFAKEVGKAFVISAASTAGMMVGLALVGYFVGRRQEKNVVQEAAKTLEND